MESEVGVIALWDAVMHAMCSGCITYILTYDHPDIHEYKQFTYCL